MKKSLVTQGKGSENNNKGHQKWSENNQMCSRDRKQAMEVKDRGQESKEERGRN